jgi:hypothetical protein
MATLSRNNIRFELSVSVFNQLTKYTNAVPSVQIAFRPCIARPGAFVACVPNADSWFKIGLNLLQLRQQFGLFDEMRYRERSTC